MLRIYSTVIEVLGMLRPVVAQIEAHDRDLARQLRRAAASVALNISEGSGCRGGTRRERYHNALGSARETGACLDVAEALGYLGSVDAVLRDRLDMVRATLVKNVA
jgi:four helix bundle protein